MENKAGNIGIICNQISRKITFSDCRANNKPIIVEIIFKLDLKPFITGETVRIM